MPASARRLGALLVLATCALALLGVGAPAAHATVDCVPSQNVVVDQDDHWTFTVACVSVGGALDNVTVATPPAATDVTVTDVDPNQFEVEATNGYWGMTSATLTVSDDTGGGDDTILVNIRVNAAPTGCLSPPGPPQSRLMNEDAAPLVATPTPCSDPDSYPNPALAYTIEPTDVPAHGIASITNAATGEFQYTPDANFAGYDPFTITVTDGAISRTFTMTISVAPVDDDSVCDLAATVDEDEMLDDEPLGCTDVDGAITTYAAGANAAANGTLTINANGTFDYAPNPNFNGSDDFSVVVADDSGDSTEVTVIVTVDAVDDMAVCDLTHATNEDTELTDADTACTDVDGPIFFYDEGTNLPAHGTLLINGSGFFTYTPDPNFTGADDFSMVANGMGGLSEVTIVMTVNPVDDAPTCPVSAAPLATAEDTPGALTNLCSDLDGDALTYSTSSSPAHGTLSFSGSTATYTPVANFHGTDTFAVRATANGLFATRSVNVFVSATNDLTLCAAPIELTTKQGEGVTHAVSCSDADGGTIAFAIGDAPTGGTATFEAGVLTYTPRATTRGSDAFSLLVTEGGATTEVQVDVTVTPVNTGGAGSDELFGGSLADTLSGGGGNDTVDAGGGNDKVAGGSGNDTLRGGAGNDRVDGGTGNDTVEGGTGNDTVTGGAGADKIRGGTGRDSHSGGAGNDSINSADTGSSVDTVTCGAGRDSVVANRKDKVAKDCERVTRGG